MGTEVVVFLGVAMIVCLTIMTIIFLSLAHQTEKLIENHKEKWIRQEGINDDYIETWAKLGQRIRWCEMECMKHASVEAKKKLRKIREN